VSKTWKMAKHPWKDPADWRRMLNRQYRAKWRQCLRDQRYDIPYHPKKHSAGWYW
jgi:hypothetical protein